MDCEEDKGVDVGDCWSRKESGEGDSIQGTVPGSKAKGKPKMVWIDNIK